MFLVLPRLTKTGGSREIWGFRSLSEKGTATRWSYSFFAKVGSVLNYSGVAEILAHFFGYVQILSTGSFVWSKKQLANMLLGVTASTWCHRPHSFLQFYPRFYFHLSIEIICNHIERNRDFWLAWSWVRPGKRRLKNYSISARIAERLVHPVEELCVYIYMSFVYE